MRPRVPPARYVAYAAFFAILAVAVYEFRHGQSEGMLPRLAAALSQNGASVAGPGADRAAAPAAPDASKLPTVIKLGSKPSAPLAAPAGANLPTVVRLGTGASAAAGAAHGIEVVDGDTFRVAGQSYRLVGIDTPESAPRARCLNERELATRATRRLRELVAGRNVLLERVPCSCPAGTEGTPACNYGRLCGALWSDNRNVGQILIDEGLAKKYDCSGGTCPPKPNWC